MASGVSPPGPGPGSSASEANLSPSPRHVPINEERSWRARWRATASARPSCPVCPPSSPGRAHGLWSSAHSERAGKIRVRAWGTRRGTLTGRSQHGLLCQLLTALRPVSFPTNSPRSGQVISGYGQDEGPVRGGLGATQGLLGPCRAGGRGPRTSSSWFPFSFVKEQRRSSVENEVVNGCFRTMMKIFRFRVCCSKVGLDCRRQNDCRDLRAQ